jgi:hypothetical protein
VNANQEFPLLSLLRLTPISMVVQFLTLSQSRKLLKIVLDYKAHVVYYLFMPTAYASLAAEVENTYGVSLLAAPVFAILWAAEKLVRTLGADEARKQLSAANRRRDKAGKMPAYPEYGMVLFGGRRAK